MGGHVDQSARRDDRGLHRPTGGPEVIVLPGKSEFVLFICISGQSEIEDPASAFFSLTCDFKSVRHGPLRISWTVPLHRHEPLHDRLHH